MQYNQPYGVTDTNAPYINGNPSTGQMGSIPPAASIEYPQREIVNFITDAGLVPDNADLHQTAKSVQSGGVVFGIDSGAVNLVSIALTPPLEDYVDGMHVWVRVAISNTGPAVCSINGLGGKNIVRRGGGVLEPGDLPGGFMSLLVYNGPHGNFELYGIAYQPATGAPVLTANSNLYVDAAIGSDTLYDGTAADTSVPPHGPFKTIQHAIDTTFKYGPSVYTMTINVAAGTYPEAVTTPNVIGPTVIIKGAGVNATYVTGANNRHTFQCTNANNMVVQNLCTSTGSGVGPPCNFSSVAGASISCSNTASQGATPGYIFEAYAGYIYIGNHTFNAGSSCNQVFGAYFGGFVGLNQNATYTIAGAFTVGAFAVASSNGSMEAGVPNPPTFVGAGFVTGTKYIATLNGVINTQALGVSWFPGSVAGYTQQGGQYN